MKLKTGHCTSQDVRTNLLTTRTPRISVWYRTAIAHHTLKDCKQTEIMTSKVVPIGDDIRHEHAKVEQQQELTPETIALVKAPSCPARTRERNNADELGQQRCRAASMPARSLASRDFFIDPYDDRPNLNATNMIKRDIPTDPLQRDRSGKVSWKKVKERSGKPAQCRCRIQ